ncbi:methyltransferase [Kribbella deserti]|uniref:Methyltransferase n=1 Tax=Kribbella deserti TaxID=1926257 RepID=A0ABV6QYV8_9ACTN
MTESGGALVPGTAENVARLLDAAARFFTSQAIFAFTRLGLADILAQGNTPIINLASATGTHEQSLSRVLRAVAHSGLVTIDPNATVSLTDMGHLLRIDHPMSLRPLVIYLAEDWMWHCASDMEASLKTEVPAFDRRYQQSLFEFFEARKDRALIFDEAMTASSRYTNAAFLDAYRIPDHSRVIDIGGGQGNFISEILESNTTLSGTLFDLPRVIQSARTNDAISGRCEFIEGNFFDRVPSGGDIYILRGVIHDWNDEDAVAILKNCRSAMTRRSKLLILETMAPPIEHYFPGQFIDFQIFLLTPGRERTEAEFRSLLAASGLKLRQVLPIFSFFALLEICISD